jgi:hypothetical protein
MIPKMTPMVMLIMIPLNILIRVNIIFLMNGVIGILEWILSSRARLSRNPVFVSSVLRDLYFNANIKPLKLGQPGGRLLQQLVRSICAEFFPVGFSPI